MEQPLKAIREPARKVVRLAVLGSMLLAMSPAARAGVIFPITSLSCSYSNTGGIDQINGGECGGVVSQLPEQNGMAGVKLYLSNAIVVSGFTGLNTAGFTLMSAGSLNESLPAGTTIPLHYSVTLSASEGSSIQMWFMGMSIASEFGNVPKGGWGMIGEGGGTFTGWMTLTTTDEAHAGNAALDGMRLIAGMSNVHWTAAPGGTLTITVSPESFDFNAVPEPASLALAGFGLGFGAWVSRYGRKIGPR